MARKHLIYCLLVIGFLFSNHTQVAQAQSTVAEAKGVTLKLGTMRDSKPWSQYENGSWSGIAIDIYRSIFGFLNKPLEIVPFDNYPRIIGELTAGNIDICPNFRMGAAPMLTNASMICTNEFFSKASWGAYALSDGGISPLDQKSELVRYHVGTTRGLGLNYLPELKDTSLTLVREPSQLVHLLSSKRVDLVVVSKEVAKAWEASFVLKTQEVIQLGHYFVHLCFSKSSLGEAGAQSLQVSVDTYLRMINTHKRKSLQAAILQPSFHTSPQQ